VRKNLEKTTVSVVHEQASVCQAAKELLASSGFNVHVFPCVERFLGSARLHCTSCLVVDVEMPPADGFFLQGYFTVRRIPVIFVTASPHQNVRERAVAAGAIDFMHRPNGAQALLDLIRSVVSPGELVRNRGKQTDTTMRDGIEPTQS
jgi:FixJ family two-component response regulator